MGLVGFLRLLRSGFRASQLCLVGSETGIGIEGPLLGLIVATIDFDHVLEDVVRHVIEPHPKQCGIILFMHPHLAESGALRYLPRAPVFDPINNAHDLQQEMAQQD